MAQTAMKHDMKTGMAKAGEGHIGDLMLTGGWTRATPKSAPTGAGFVTITNKGDAADRLVGVKTSIAARSEVHTMEMDKGVMKMRQLVKGLEIPAGETVLLKPGGFHMMFIGLKGPIDMGSTVKATLVFEKAGEVVLDLPAAKIGAGKPMGEHAHGQN